MDGRPSEVEARVPNALADDVAELESFARMWLDSESLGGALLQFYPSQEMVFRQLAGETHYQQTALLFEAERTLDLRRTTRSALSGQARQRDTFPTRLSTPLSVLEACWPRGGLLGVYRGRDEPIESVPTPGATHRRFLVPRALLAVSLASSPPYLRRLTAGGEGGVLPAQQASHVGGRERRGGEPFPACALISSRERGVVEQLALGLQPPSSSFATLTRSSAAELARAVRALTPAHFIFPLIELGDETDATDARALFAEESWTLDGYGLYERRA